MTKVKGMQWSSYSRVAVEESGKMSVIWLSESAEVFNARIRVQLYLCCCWDGASFMSTNTTTASPPPYSLCITLHHSISLSVSLSCFCGVFSHSLTHTSLFPGLSPLCLIILLSLWVFLSLSAVLCVSVLFHFSSSNSAFILPLFVSIKLLSSLNAFTIHHCLYDGPESAYIT